MAGAVESGNPVNAASVVVLLRGAVLMVERARPPLAGLWSFPGGRLEPGEDAETAARRELLEETGLKVGTLIRIGTSEPVKGSTFRLAVFAARAGDAEPVAADDAKRAEFVEFRAVLERKTTSGAAAWIARAIEALADPPLP